MVLFIVNYVSVRKTNSASFLRLELLPVTKLGKKFAPLVFTVRRNHQAIRLQEDDPSVSLSSFIPVATNSLCEQSQCKICLQLKLTKLGSSLHTQLLTYGLGPLALKEWEIVRQGRARFTIG